ncbi:AbiH family protein [Maribacter litoralis]|uniref:AbiH family protein n=1 Tax=Maribacter litoralis TaxID=2059726 RepID=UPI003D2D457C
MKNLILIGNGFDLAHNLKTSYEDFKKYLQVKVRNDDLKTPLIRSMLNDNIDKWSDIESTYFDILINFNNREFLQQNYSGNIFGYSTPKEFNDDFDNIKKYLSIYLQETEKQFQPIKNYNKFFELFDNKDAVVVNFNYTNTVKKYLEGKSIELIHMHGELGNDENPIIFGFAANHEESKTLLTENDNNYVRNIKKFNYLFTNNENTLNKHLKSEEFNVFILGHSCGISDGLILSQIFNSKNINQIIPFYYKNRTGYFDTMVNVDRIIDDYSKESTAKKSFSKLISFPMSYPMPQRDEDENLETYLKSIVNEMLPKEKERFELNKSMAYTPNY